MTVLKRYLVSTVVTIIHVTVIRSEFRTGLVHNQYRYAIHCYALLINMDT
jgi:hypothetical protein